MIDNRVVGRTIAALRQRKGMTQQQLAAAMNVSHQAVSKWENGAALPDIQTMVALTQLFGVTVEQLLRGEIPGEPGMSEKTCDPLQSVGKFVSNVAEGFGSFFRSASPDEANEEKTEEADEKNAEIDLKELLEMAPFMSRGAVSEMLLSADRKLTAEQIAKFAPFVDTSCLERLIQRSNPEISWNTLRQLAPFLKREAVDALAKAIAMGERVMKQSSVDVEKTATDVYHALEDASKKLGAGVDKAVRKVVEFGESVVGEVGKAVEELAYETESGEKRLARLRRAAFEKALEKEQWDWIAVHREEISDDALRRNIAEKAREKGMSEWVKENFGDITDESCVDEAIVSGDWNWMGEHVHELDAEAQLRVAEAALEQRCWDWIADHIQSIRLGARADAFVNGAMDGKAYEAAAAIALSQYDPGQLERFVLKALGEGEYDAVELMIACIPAGTLSGCCMALAKKGKWEPAARYIDRFDASVLDRLYGCAVDAANFDMIDILDEKMREGAEVDDYE